MTAAGYMYALRSSRGRQTALLLLFIIPTQKTEADNLPVGDSADFPLIAVASVGEYSLGLMLMLFQQSIYRDVFVRLYAYRSGRW